MKFRIVELQQGVLPALVEGSLPGHAAAKVAELGGRGQCVLEDETGNRTTWNLYATTIHYAYPVIS